MNQRRLFADELYKHMKVNPDIYLLVGDLGYKVFDQHKEDYPERVINCGASEQAMMDIAVGLAYENKRVFTYTITPFYYRAFETIRTYIAHEHLPVIMVGSGRDEDYEHDGYSHNASDVQRILKAVGNITLLFPETVLALPSMVNQCVSTDSPVFLSLRR